MVLCLPLAMPHVFTTGLSQTSQLPVCVHFQFHPSCGLPLFGSRPNSSPPGPNQLKGDSLAALPPPVVAGHWPYH